ncbi:MAG: DeoR/GlpR transcriptional regulator [Chloroflexi bacterium]|nr:DeoR/GlpR transcriptional regulator [Chloroflexota bacterium]
MLVSERHNQIEIILRQRKTVSVAELSELLHVSPVTIRNDLNHLAEEGRLLRTHGGATINSRANGEFSFVQRKRLRAAEKSRIGKLAASLITPVESVLLDSSTTALAIAEAIKHRPELGDLTIVTTGVYTALAVTGTPGITTILTGGILRDVTGSITGSLVTDVLAKINIHKAFLGAWGLTCEEGLTDTSLEEAEVKQHIIAHCPEVIVVLDSTKLGRVALASFASIEQISRVITDDGADPVLMQKLRERRVEVLIA